MLNQVLVKRVENKKRKLMSRNFKPQLKRWKTSVEVDESPASNNASADNFSLENHIHAKDTELK